MGTVNELLEWVEGHLEVLTLDPATLGTEEGTPILCVKTLHVGTLCAILDDINTQTGADWYGILSLPAKPQPKSSVSVRFFRGPAPKSRGTSIVFSETDIRELGDRAASKLSGLVMMTSTQVCTTSHPDYLILSAVNDEVDINTGIFSPYFRQEITDIVVCHGSVHINAERPIDVVRKRPQDDTDLPPSKRAKTVR